MASRIRKEGIKLSLFATEMFLYVEISKESLKTLLELKNEFSKVAGYNIHIQKLLVFCIVAMNKPNMKNFLIFHLQKHLKEYNT